MCDIDENSCVSVASINGESSESEEDEEEEDDDDESLLTSISVAVMERVCVYMNRRDIKR